MKSAPSKPKKSRPSRNGPVAEIERARFAAQLRQAKEELAIFQQEDELRNLREGMAEIEDSRAHYADLYDFAPVGFITLDRYGMIHALNVTAAQILNTKRAELLGRPLLPLVVEADRRKLLQHLGRLRNGEPQVI